VRSKAKYPFINFIFVFFIALALAVFGVGLVKRQMVRTGIEQVMKDEWGAYIKNKPNFHGGLAITFVQQVFPKLSPPQPLCFWHRREN